MNNCWLDNAKTQRAKLVRTKLPQQANQVAALHVCPRCPQCCFKEFKWNSDWKIAHPL